VKRSRRNHTAAFKAKVALRNVSMGLMPRVTRLEVSLVG